MLVISNRLHASLSSDFQITRAIAPSRMDCGFCSLNRADWRILKTQWIVDQLRFLTRISDCACLMFGSWVLNKICIIDLSSALVGMLMSSSKLFLFFERNSFKLKCETVIGIVLCYSQQACCLLYSWAKLTVAFTIYTEFYFRMWLWFRI